MIRFVIPGRLPGLNEYTRANRSNAYQGAKMKQDAENLIIYQIRSQLAVEGVKMIDRPVTINFTWFEKDLRRDLDNVAFAKKFILDALVKAKKLEDDSPKYVKGFSDTFKIDKKNPRIEVSLSYTE